MISGATISNGMSWTEDNKTMYWTDTQESTIFAYDYDVESGNISNKRVFFKSDEGGPDGHAQDQDGNLWVALWGASKVVRISPRGVITAEIVVPTRCPTVSQPQEPLRHCNIC
jgi:sugar lactone lactonase YvrE